MKGDVPENAADDPHGILLLTVARLRVELLDRGLRRIGNKPELVEQLLELFENENWEPGMDNDTSTNATGLNGSVTNTPLPMATLPIPPAPPHLLLTTDATAINVSVTNAPS